MVLEAMVQQVNNNGLLVREISTGEEIRVHTSDWRRFSRNDCVRITHDGRMTMSIPPQVTAISIELCRTNCCVPPRPPVHSRPSEMRATVMQRRRDGLLVIDLRNNRTLFVRTPHANHFCARQRILVTYDNIRMNNPPEIVAIDITLLC